MDAATLYRRSRRLVLAGAPHVVRELTIRDVARLGQLAEGRRAWPLDVLAAQGECPDAEGWRARIRAAFLDAESAVRGEPEPAEKLEAAIDLAWLAIRRPPSRRRLAHRAAWELFSRLSPAEWAQVQAIAYGLRPVDVLARLIDPEWGRRGTPEGVPWGRAIDEVAAERGWTYDQVGRLTLTQFANARRGGKPPEDADMELPPGEDVARIAATRRARFFGEDGAGEG
jgi:hypothetical protein